LEVSIARYSYRGARSRLGRGDRYYEFDSVEMAEATYESEGYRVALAAMMGGVERDFRILVGV
jgi:uncharacterized protein (DUF1330 family)